MNKSPLLPFASPGTQLKLNPAVRLTHLFLGAAFASAAIFCSTWLQDGVAWRSDEFFGRPSRSQLHYEKAMFAFFQETSALSAPGAIVMLGDSHLQGIPAQSVVSSALNYSVGGLTASRLDRYLSDGTATFPLKPSRVVLMIGQNDLEEGASGEVLLDVMSGLLTKLSGQAPVMLLELIAAPTTKGTSSGPEAIQSLNARLKALCEKSPQCRPVSLAGLRGPNGDIATDYVFIDGKHLNEAGHRRLTTLIKDNL